MAVIPIQTDLDPIVAGDDRAFTFNITSTSDTIAVGDWTGFFTIKSAYDLADSAASVSIASSNITTSTISSSSGVCTIPFYAREGASVSATPLEAGTYFYDIQFLIDGGIYTWMTGKIKVLPQVTRSSS